MMASINAGTLPAVSFVGKQQASRPFTAQAPLRSSRPVHSFITRCENGWFLSERGNFCRTIAVALLCLDDLRMCMHIFAMQMP